MKDHSDRLTDDYLVLRAQAGNVEALEALLVRWQRRFWSVACSLTNRDAANDVLQEAMLAIVRSIGKLEDPACFKSWAYRIVSNKSRDWLRSNQRRQRLEESVSKEQAPEGALGSPDSVALNRDSLEGLPPDQRTILKLFYLEGMSVREIAVVLRLPDGTVKSRLFHARASLKKLIQHNQSS